MGVVSSDNRVRLPAEALRDAGLVPGDEVWIRCVGPGRIELVNTDALIAEFAGVFDEQVYPPEYLDEVRRGWA